MQKVKIKLHSLEVTVGQKSCYPTLKKGKTERENAAHKFEIKCKDGPKRHLRGICWNFIRPFMDKNTDNAETNQAWEKQRRISR